MYSRFPDRSPLDTGSGTPWRSSGLLRPSIFTRMSAYRFSSSRVKRTNTSSQQGCRRSGDACGAVAPAIRPTSCQSHRRGRRPVSGIMAWLANADSSVVLPVAAFIVSEGTCDFRGVINPCSLLQRRGSSVRTAGSAGGVTAGKINLFDDNHLGAKMMGFNSSSQTSTAGTKRSRHPC